MTPTPTTCFEMDTRSGKKRKVSCSEKMAKAQDDQKQNEKSVSPFTVFPEELWLMMLDNLTESMDIQNLFSTFPQFRTIFDAKFGTFQFDQVSPMLFSLDNPNPEDRPLQNQLISKPWSVMVTNFLENNAPSLTRKRKKQPQLKSVSCSTFLYTDSRSNLTQLYPMEFTTVEEILAFKSKSIDEIEELFSSQKIKFCCGEKTPPQEFLDECHSLLGSSGSYIKHVELDFGTFHPATQVEAKDILDKVLACLSSLQNVISLSFNLNSKDKTKYLLNLISICETYPKLPFLDYLDLSKVTNLGPALLNYFFKGYCSHDQMNKINLPLKPWKPNHRLRFGYLREIQINVNAPAGNLPKMLKNLEFAILSKLCLNLSHKNLLLTMPEIFKSLQGHNVRHLEIDNSDIFCHLLCPNVDIPIVPSVKYMKITDASELGFQFLTGLPSLQYLHAKCKDELRDRILNGRSDVTEPLTTLVRSYLYYPKVPKNLNLWQELPSLKALIADDDGVVKHFVPAYGNDAVTFTF